MGRFDSTKAAIDANIKKNDNQEITGSILNYVMNNMVDATESQLEATDARITEVSGALAEESSEIDALATELESQNEMIEDLQNSKIDKEADDYYPQLSVGLADNLAGVDVVASEVSFRRSGGGAISDGVARIEAIKGNSVVWNQSATSQGAKGSYDNSAGNSTIYWPSGLDVNYTERINGHKVFMSVIDRIGVIPIFYFADKIQLNLLTGLIVTANTTQQDKNGIIAQVPAGVNASWDIDCLFVDLTQMFGVGNEPSTIEEFYQRIPMGVDLYAYNEGEVIHMNAQSLVSCNVDSTICKEQSLDVVRKYFLEGMKSSASAHDEIRYNKATQKWEKVEAIGVRAYQDGDADNTAYLTDGTVTCYPLAEPIVTEIEGDFNLDYEVWNGGTEKIVSDVPTTPLKADIAYGFNAVGKIKENSQQLTELSAEVSGLSERIDNLPSGESSVFEAKFGETTHEEIVAAVNEKKHIICFHKNRVYNLCNFQQGMDLLFTCAAAAIYTITLKITSSNWVESQYDYEIAINKVTTINESSTNTKYPSAKAVYDFVSNTLGTIINGDY